VRADAAGRWSVELEPGDGYFRVGAPTYEDSEEVTGRVLGADGSPVTWCGVVWESGLVTGTVDEEGRFRLEHLPPGAGKLTVYDPEAGMHEHLAQVPVTVIESGVANVEVRLG